MHDASPARAGSAPHPETGALKSDFHVVIPARLASSRLPGKVLLDLGGEPLFVHAVRAARAAGAASVRVATDTVAVAEACMARGIPCVETRADHASGTDRLHEVALAAGWADDVVVVNLQADEPFMPPALLGRVARLLAADPGADWATLAHPILDAAEWHDPACVKVVRRADGRALYFSRAPIPFPRDAAAAARPEPAPLPPGALRHIGLYAYRVGGLKRYATLAASDLEGTEALEQLRALEAGLAIGVGVVAEPPPRGVDTAEDYALARKRLVRDR